MPETPRAECELGHPVRQDGVHLRGEDARRHKQPVPEAETWLANQPKNIDGKVSLQVLIAEGQQRGYCICPKPMRQMISFEGMNCSWCGMPDTKKSHEFWYGT